MKIRSRFGMAALALLTVGALSVPVIAQAHKKSYPTTVTASVQNKNQVDGNIASTKPACLPQRSVSVYSPAGLLEFSTTTDAQGGFRIQSKDLAPGVHTVNVKKRVIRKNRRHTHRCRAAQTAFTIS